MAESDDDQRTFDFAVSLLLTIGIVVSYIPQIIKILQKKSSAGIAALTQTLSFISSGGGVINVVLLQSRLTVRYCKVSSTFLCIKQLSAILKIASQFVCICFIFFLFHFYFKVENRCPERELNQAQNSQVLPCASPETSPGICIEGGAGSNDSIGVEASSQEEEQNDSMNDRATFLRLRRRARIIGLTALLTLIVAAIVMIVMLLLENEEECVEDATATRSFVGAPVECVGKKRDIVVSFAWYLGIASMVAAAFQYFPQIFLTVTTKSVGSLSIPTMAIQTPGTIVLIYSLSRDIGTNWSTYLQYVVSALCQGTLLSIAIYLTLKSKRTQRRLLQQSVALGCPESSSNSTNSPCSSPEVQRKFETPCVSSSSAAEKTPEKPSSAPLLDQNSAETLSHSNNVESSQSEVNLNKP